MGSLVKGISKARIQDITPCVTESVQCPNH